MCLCNSDGTSNARVLASLVQFAEHSLLLEFVGSDPALEPFALLSHYDVVPADASVWKHHPFSGTIEDGYAVPLIAFSNKTQSEYLPVNEVLPYLHDQSRKQAHSQVGWQAG